MENVVNINNAWLMYKIPFSSAGKIVWDNFWALQNITFSVKRGESFGIMGENGSGKSTLLKLIAGLLKPDRGSINTSGKICGLLELGAGFEPELTGKENVEFNARLFGMNDRQIAEVFDDIVCFADIGRFINAPVKCYSQGMFVRLAFAAAIHMQPEILLIDDSLAVGVKYFQKKCIQKICELKDQGKTIIFVCHDVNLLSRLCSRAILLKDGRIVNDDSAQKVVALYNQTQGTHAGVGVIRQQDLSIVFNDGRLLLNWKDILLTPAPGIYTMFRFNGKGYNSLQAVWTIDKKCPERIVATGEFFSLGLIQTWTIEINEQLRLSINIELSSISPGSFEIEEGLFNVLLSDNYTQWLTSQDSGKFSEITREDNKWQAILADGSSRRAIGVAGAKDSQLPVLAIERLSNTTGENAQIFNTDFSTHARVLQYKTFKLENFSADKAGRCEFFSGQILINIPDATSYVKTLQEEFTLEGANLKAQVNNGKCSLLWQDAPVTKANHIHCLIYANGKWYSSHLARWQVKKESDGSIVAQGTWPNLPLIQQWKLNISAQEDAFTWEVSLLVGQETVIVQQHVYAMFSEGYDLWDSDYGKGLFPPSFVESEIDLLQRCISQGPIILNNKQSSLPEISVLFSPGLSNFGKIFNSDASYRSRVIRIDKIEPETCTAFAPGEHQSFKLQVSGREKSKQAGKMLFADTRLKKNKLSLLFDNGRCRLFWQDREMTKQLGVYTSLCWQGRWHDSHSKAVWDVLAYTQSQITVSGKWMHLPVRQKWTASFADGNTILLTMKIIVQENISFDCLQANVMLSEQYTNWQTAYARDIFPEIPKDVDDNWQIVSPRARTPYVAVERIQGVFPAVWLYANKNKQSDDLFVLNTDIYHRGRVLQNRLKGPESFAPGEYLFYEGKIIVSEEV